MKAAVQAAIALGNHNTFVGLHTLATTFNHVDADDNGVARCEFGDGLSRGEQFLLAQEFGSGS
jgi:hypothetical protein